MAKTTGIAGDREERKLRDREIVQILNGVSAIGTARQRSLTSDEQDHLPAQLAAMQRRGIEVGKKISLAGKLLTVGEIIPHPGDGKKANISVHLKAPRRSHPLKYTWEGLRQQQFTPVVDD